jgi:hypothetical protein
MIKKLLILVTVLLVIGSSAACTGTGGSSGDINKPIEPGDKVGDFVVNTGQEGSFTYGFSVDCAEMSAANTYSCKATTGDVINVSTGLYDTTGSGNLDEIWAHSNYQIFINDRPVDLPAFGTIDYNHQQVGAIRFANVVISTSKAGEITVRDSGVFDNGDPFTSTSTYIYSKP